MEGAVRGITYSVMPALVAGGLKTPNKRTPLVSLRVFCEWFCVSA